VHPGLGLGWDQRKKGIKGLEILAMERIGEAIEAI
jgi:hypothetical protein